MTKITEQTWFPLSMVAALVVTVGGGSWAASAFTSRLSIAEKDVADLQSFRTDIVKELKEVNRNLIEIKASLPKRRGE